MYVSHPEHKRPGPAKAVQLAIWLWLACLGLAAAPCLAADPPQAGDTLPDLVLNASDRPQDASYLGLESNAPTFELKNVKAKVVLLEIVGVYCPFCHEQTPLFNDLHKRLQRAKLDKDVKLIALASGATLQEIDYLRTHSAYAYPVLRDEDFSAHKKLNEPKTPFTMLVDAKGKVLYAHKGVINDIDGLFAKIKDLAK